MIHLSRADFDQAVQQALDDVPDEFRPYMENLVVEVRSRPDKAFCRAHDVPADLLGLYVGVPLEEKGPDQVAALPDRVVLFSANLCEMCETEEELIDEIRVTVLHELGHHFGLDEDRLEELGFD